MNRTLVGKRPTFHRSQQRSNSYRIMLWLFLIMGGLWMLLQVQRGEVEPLFSPTPTPTRVFNSYIQEARAYFDSGKIDDPNSENDAIDTYRLALLVDPDNSEIWAELARIQTYSSSLLSTTQEVKARLGKLEQPSKKLSSWTPTAATRMPSRPWCWIGAPPMQRTIKKGTGCLPRR
jgi:hypothetical protein